MKRKGGDLEDEPSEHRQQTQDEQAIGVGHGFGRGGQARRARGSVDERQAVGHHRGRHAAHEEELQRRFRRARLPLGESSQDVERDRHQLERDEEQHEIARRREDEHPEQRREHEDVVLTGATEERPARQRQPAEQPDERCGQEQPLGEESQAVLDERAAELRGRRREWQGEERERQRPGRGEPADPAAVVASREERRDEHEQHERSDSDLERKRDHGATIRASRGTVAVSTGPRARPGTRPNRTITPTRITSATHSGPRASSR